MSKNENSPWLIIGSVAMYHWFKDARQPKDIDLLSSVVNKQLPVLDSQWHDVAQKIIQSSNDKVFADPNILYTLKVSHAQWDINWEKTLYDVVFLKQKGCSLLPDIHAELVSLWETIHGKKSVKMNESVDEFFKKYVVRKFNHEKVHESVAYYNTPMHERIRPDLSNVWCSSDMFFKLPLEMQHATGKEELLVTAIERFNLTSKSTKTQCLVALQKAYKLLCTSMTKGWFALFLIENYKEIFLDSKQELYGKIISALEFLELNLNEKVNDE